MLTPERERKYGLEQDLAATVLLDDVARLGAGAPQIVRALADALRTARRHVVELEDQLYDR